MSLSGIIAHRGKNMKIFAALLLALICIPNLASPQSRPRHKTGKLRKNSKRVQPSKKSTISRSTVGLNFRFVTPDRKSGVWIAGSAWLLRGLMVNDRDDQTNAITIPGVQSVSEVHFVTPDVGWMTDLRSLYRTLDGGNSWQKVEIRDKADVHTVYFSDIQNGWVGGWKGEIYHTTNAG